MTNEDKYNKTFQETFSVDETELLNLNRDDIPSWDSVGHMALIAALEDEFDIMFETDDILNFKSYTGGKDILAKYNILIK